MSCSQLCRGRKEALSTRDQYFLPTYEDIPYKSYRFENQKLQIFKILLDRDWTKRSSLKRAGNNESHIEKYTFSYSSYLQCGEVY